MITLRTTQGDISIELDFANAPKSAANYLQYARDGFYNGTIFHRVIPGFMVQGGGMDANMQEKASRDSIENEADNGLANDIGTLAMARTNDPHSASSQFFINVSNNGFLNHSGKNSQGWGYAVFGKVVDGMDVVNASPKCLQAALATTRMFRLKLLRSPKLLSAMPTLTNK